MKQLRIYHIPQLGVKNGTLYIPVENELEAFKIMYTLDIYDLFQLNRRIKPDFCNITGLEIFDYDTKDWYDWYYEDDKNDKFYDVNNLEQFIKDKYKDFNLDDFKKILCKQTK